MREQATFPCLTFASQRFRFNFFSIIGPLSSNKSAGALVLAPDFSLKKSSSTCSWRGKTGECVLWGERESEREKGVSGYLVHQSWD